MSFTPTNDWQNVSEDDVLPPGLEIRMNMSSGESQARLRQVPKPPSKLTRVLSWVAKQAARLR